MPPVGEKLAVFLGNVFSQLLDFRPEKRRGLLGDLRAGLHVPFHVAVRGGIGNVRGEPGRGGDGRELDDVGVLDPLGIHPFLNALSQVDDSRLGGRLRALFRQKPEEPALGRTVVRIVDELQSLDDSLGDLAALNQLDLCGQELGIPLIAAGFQRSRVELTSSLFERKHDSRLICRLGKDSDETRDRERGEDAQEDEPPPLKQDGPVFEKMGLDLRLLGPCQLIRTLPTVRTSEKGLLCDNHVVASKHRIGFLAGDDPVEVGYLFGVLAVRPPTLDPNRMGRSVGQASRLRDHGEQCDSVVAVELQSPRLLDLSEAKDTNRPPRRDVHDVAGGERDVPLRSGGAKEVVHLDFECVRKTVIRSAEDVNFSACRLPSARRRPKSPGAASSTPRRPGNRGDRRSRRSRPACSQTP